jgi:hypothetical protein
MKKHKWIGLVDFKHLGKNGAVLWEVKDRENFLADEGEYNLLNLFLVGGTAPTTFHIRLFNDTPVETDAIANITGEPSGNGYPAGGIEVERSATGWPTLALDSNDYQATSKTVTFTASGGSIGPVTYAVLAATISAAEKHIASVALSQSRTLAAGESLQVTYKVKLSEAA